MTKKDEFQEEIIDDNDTAEVIDPADGDVVVDSDNEGEADDYDEEELERLNEAMDEGLMMTGEEQEEIQLHNDSIAYFDQHKDSIFTITQHPRYPALIVTGGSEGDDDDAPGKAYAIDTSSAPERPVLPASFSSSPDTHERASHELQPLFTMDGHKDSVTVATFTYPDGDFLVTGSMDGTIQVHHVKIGESPTFSFVAEACEVPEVTWLAASRGTKHPNAFALGSSDGSVWVYTVELGGDGNSSLELVQTFFGRSAASSTAGAWTPDGEFLVGVTEDASLYVWDVWGTAALAGMKTLDGGSAILVLTADDQRFEVEGGLFSLAIDPRGATVAVGGADGAIKVVSLPRLGGAAPAQGARRPVGGGKKTVGDSGSSAAGGQILASLQTQSDAIESLAFGDPTGTGTNVLLAAGSLDGSIAVFEAARNYAVRRHLAGAHEDFAVVKISFVPQSWLLTSCGMDGVVRRWDMRAGATPGILQASQLRGGPQQQSTPQPAPQQQHTAAEAGLVKEWKGHRGDGEGGGVLDFVQGQTGSRVMTAGDDGIVLIFEA